MTPISSATSAAVDVMDAIRSLSDLSKTALKFAGPVGELIGNILQIGFPVSFKFKYKLVILGKCGRGLFQG